MANNYTQFSEMILTQSAEEKDFLVLGFTSLDDLTERLANDAEAGGTYNENHDYSEDARALYISKFGEEALEFAEERGDQAFAVEDAGVWLKSDEVGNVELIARVVSAWQKQFDIQEAWYITWSSSCSAPRVGEFGGGALIIHKGEAHWINAFTWTAAMKRVLEGGAAANDEAALSSKLVELQHELDRADHALHGILEQADALGAVDESSRDAVLAAVRDLAVPRRP